ncbi:hypothetical protein CEV32_2180 [Brucella rhizosphaerae]|uniref:Uncharacterized protein n=1 Tax=Brucella rhizosphaerae TaxID=571254 RepID=A0A256F4G4_9HYPH|nr:hypothetical protein CEV32_2180 [Brucella rhizosphaerae]
MTFKKASQAANPLVTNPLATTEATELPLTYSVKPLRSTG